MRQPRQLKGNPLSRKKRFTLVAFLVLSAMVGGVVASEIGGRLGEPAQGAFVVTLLATLTGVGARLFRTTGTRMSGTDGL